MLLKSSSSRAVLLFSYCAVPCVEGDLYTSTVVFTASIPPGQFAVATIKTAVFDVLPGSVKVISSSTT